MIFKNLSKLAKTIIGSSLIGSGIVYTIIPLTLSAPGLGLESNHFISSVEEQVNHIFPKNKFVLDGASILYDIIANNSLKATFIANAVSTIDFSQDETGEIKLKYETFANDWWIKNWDNKVKEKQDIDLNEIGINLIDFDIALAEEFNSPGFTRSGYGWMSQKGALNEIFSSQFYNDVKKEQTIWEQHFYESTLSWQAAGLNEFKVLSSNGGNLVNNKVWSFNQQISSIKLLLDLKDLDIANILNEDINSIQQKAISLELIAFKNTELTARDVSDYISPSDFHAPNYSTAIIQLRAAIVMLFLLILVIPLTIGLGIYLLIKWKQEGDK